MDTNPQNWSEPSRTIWRSPRTFTALIPVFGRSLHEVHEQLDNLSQKFKCTLAQVTDLHSFRMVAIPAETPDDPIRVLLNSVHDTPLTEHMPALISAVGHLIADALKGADFKHIDELPNLIVRYRISENTFHLGAINKSVQEILAEECLLETVETFADQRVATGTWKTDTPAKQIRSEVRSYVLKQSKTKNVPTGPKAKLPQQAKRLRFLDLLATFAMPAIGILAPHVENSIRRIRDPLTRIFAWSGYGLWWIYGTVFTGAALLLVRMVELSEDDIVAPNPDPQKVKKLEDAEDNHLKNAVTIWFPIRDSWVRRFLVTLILWGAERGCRHFWTNGALAGIDTIHYARFVQANKGRSMLFMSDYDGSLDRYLMDFIGVGSNAVIPISSSIAGCPPVRWLFSPDDPATFGPRWRSLIRTYQLETPIWYNAYPNLNVNDILSNAQIREGLFAETMSEQEAQRWTAML